ncbi:MAG: hypothetical protein AVDCRST_MAG56-7777, partial [uncultured Cytophagales bacterium]
APPFAATSRAVFQPLAKPVHLRRLFAGLPKRFKGNSV